MVAWAHGTSGIVARCGPSVARAAEEIPSLEEMIQAGYVVTATDYPGLGTPGGHPYLVGTSEGRAVLDSVRAARALPGAGAGADVAIWGHSQGGHAALFAGDLAPTYAPGAPRRRPGGGRPGQRARRSSSPGTWTRSPGKVLTSMAVVSWTKLYPGRHHGSGDRDGGDPVREGRGRPLHRDDATSPSPALPDVTGFRLGFAKGDPTKTPPWDALFQQNSTPTTKLAAPLLVTQGAKDTIVWPEVTQPYVAALCKAGSVVKLTMYPSEDHFGVRTASAPEVLTWMADRFAGNPAPTTC